MVHEWRLQWCTALVLSETPKAPSLNNRLQRQHFTWHRHLCSPKDAFVHKRNTCLARLWVSFSLNISRFACKKQLDVASCAQLCSQCHELACTHIEFSSRSCRTVRWWIACCESAREREAVWPCDFKWLGSTPSTRTHDIVCGNATKFGWGAKFLGRMAKRRYNSERPFETLTPDILQRNACIWLGHGHRTCCFAHPRVSPFAILQNRHLSGRELPLFGRKRSVCTSLSAESRRTVSALVVIICPSVTTPATVITRVSRDSEQLCPVLSVLLVSLSVSGFCKTWNSSPKLWNTKGLLKFLLFSNS